MSRRDLEQNRNARIEVSQDTMTRLGVETVGRDEGTLEVRADVRLRNDVRTGQSLAGLSVRTAGGRNVRFTGQEARTLYRILKQAAGE